MQSTDFRNTLLRSLSSASLERLALREISFELGQEIEFPGTPVENLVFVEEGMASMTVTFLNGSQVEVGMFGYESVAGVSALMGTRLSLNRVYTQIAGRGFASPVAAARREFRLGGEFQFLALHYVQAQLVETEQSVACNMKHPVDRRLARWLLTCADRTRTDTFKMPQEFLADMLGSTRPTVSVAAALLKDQDLISYNRGVIRILDAGRLERAACECYRILRNHLEDPSAYDAGRATAPAA